jgi:hypothetical protein
MLLQQVLSTAERMTQTYRSLASTLFASSSTSACRSGLRGGMVMPGVLSSFPLTLPSACPGATLSLRLWLGLVSLLPRACLSKSPKLVGGCIWMADCMASFAAWRLLELCR